MRITARVAIAGNNWRPTFPSINLRECFQRVAPNDERFDEGAFRRQVANQPAVQIGGNDTPTILSYGALLIESVHNWLEAECKKANTPAAEIAARRIAQRLSTRAESSRTQAVRVDIQPILIPWHGKKVRLPRVKITTNEMGGVGKPFAAEFAMLIADFVERYNDRFEEQDNPRVILAPETIALIERKKEITKENHNEL